MVLTKPVRKVPINIQSSHKRIIIKNGTIVNDDHKFVADIYIENDTIKDIGKKLMHPGGAHEIDATGCLILPGGIDLNTNFDCDLVDDKSCTDYEIGSRAALIGGTTTIVNNVSSTSFNDKPKEYIKNIENNVCCDFVLSVQVPDDANLKYIKLIKEYALEYDIKIFHIPVDLDFEILTSLLETISELGCLAVFKPFSKKIFEYNCDKLAKKNPKEKYGPELLKYSFSDDDQVSVYMYILNVLKNVECPAVFTGITNDEILDLVKDEITPNTHLSFSVPALYHNATNLLNECWMHAASHMCKPPLSTNFNVNKCVSKLAQGFGYSSVDSNHIGVSSKQRMKGWSNARNIPCGINSVQYRMIVLWSQGVEKSGIIDPCKFVAITSSNAAKLLNMYPKKGRIDVESIADIVILNTLSNTEIDATPQDGCDMSIYSELDSKVKIQYVIKSGQIVVDNEDVFIHNQIGKHCQVEEFSYMYDTVDRVKESSQTKTPCISRDKPNDVIEDDIIVPKETNGHCTPDKPIEEEFVNKTRRNPTGVQSQLVSSISFGDYAEIKEKPSTKLQSSYFINISMVSLFMSETDILSEIKRSGKFDEWRHNAFNTMKSSKKYRKLADKIKKYATTHTRDLKLDVESRKYSIREDFTNIIFKNGSIKKEMMELINYNLNEKNMCLSIGNYLHSINPEKSEIELNIPLPQDSPINKTLK
ncbi:hypothetical protein A3Q56_02595 [Intoshia linei]|uniref:dihydropyrimidinase n=1 Tax=Intoshia linei TaxID=1819745 RepID=A0A177B5Y5_9BILA|nr:hypothetical protein A3Q56_02595 [Intoshia linei]